MNQNEDTIHVLEAAYDFIIKEYGCSRSQALDGEFVSKEARPILHKLSIAIANLKEYDGCNVCGEVYQVVGALWNGEDDLIPVLDNLSASAMGKSIPHKTLLPFSNNGNLKVVYHGEHLGHVTIPVKSYLWTCVECGSQEYTMAVSEYDVQNLGCGNCGSCEWTKEISKYG
jgi:hypothetical protein